MNPNDDTARPDMADAWTLRMGKLSKNSLPRVQEKRNLNRDTTLNPKQ